MGNPTLLGNASRRIPGLLTMVMSCLPPIGNILSAEEGIFGYDGGSVV